MQSRLAPDCGKDEMQFFCFLPKISGFGFCLRFGSGNQAQPEFGFAGFFAADAGFVFEILFGNRVIRFAIIRPDARAGSDQLAD